MGWDEKKLNQLFGNFSDHRFACLFFLFRLIHRDAYIVRMHQSLWLIEQVKCDDK